MRVGLRNDSLSSRQVLGNLCLKLRLKPGRASADVVMDEHASPRHLALLRCGAWCNEVGEWRGLWRDDERAREDTTVYVDWMTDNARQAGHHATTGSSNRGPEYRG
jgi:hypothetical protein